MIVYSDTVICTDFHDGFDEFYGNVWVVYWTLEDGTWVSSPDNRSATLMTRHLRDRTRCDIEDPITV